MCSATFFYKRQFDKSGISGFATVADPKRGTLPNRIRLSAQIASGGFGSVCTALPDLQIYFQTHVTYTPQHRCGWETAFTGTGEIKRTFFHIIGLM